MDAFEQVRIDTPEQVALELPVAGIGSRFLALAVDTLVQSGTYLLVVVLTILVPTLLTPFARLAAIGFTFAATVAILAAFCLYWGYFAAFEIWWKGQTPGKRVAGIRVIMESGRPIDPAAAVLRNLLRAIDFLPAMYGAGVLTMVLNRQSRRIGDFVAGTIVIHDHQTSALPSALSTNRRLGAGPASTAAASISQAEVTLIETYLDRRIELTPDVQERTGERIAALIKSRTGLAPADGQSTLDFLEALARQGRDAARISAHRSAM